MYDDKEITRLRRYLDSRTGPDRIPVLIELARHLSNRWAAQPAAPLAEQDVGEATMLLREARGGLRRGDIWRAQVSHTLGVLLASRAFVTGGADRQDNSDPDEAIECMTEATEHPDMPPSNLEIALLYLAMLLVVRAIPQGGVAGLRLEDLNPANAAVAPNLLSYLGMAAKPERMADLDRAEALLARLQSTPPVNEQFHRMAPILLDQIRMIRTLFGGGGMVDMMASLTKLVAMWQQPSSATAGANPSSPYGIPLAGLLSGLGPAAINGLSGLRGPLPPIVLPEIGSQPLVVAGQVEPTTNDPTITAPPASRPSRQADRTEQAVVEIGPEDRDAVIDFAQKHQVDVKIENPTARGQLTAAALVLLGPARAVRTVVDMVEHRKGGLVFDLSGGSTAKMYRSRNLAYGVLLVRARDGEVTVEVHELRDVLRQVTDAIQRLLTDLIDQPRDVILAVLERTVGDRARVFAQPSTSDGHPRSD